MNIAVIFAGGSGRRMHAGATPKQFLEMRGKPIIIYTLEVFEAHPDIDAMTVACIAEWIPHMEELVKKYGITKVKKIVPGGDTGQQSIYNGLCAAEEICKDESSIVLIHDGVRPFITDKLISDNIESVKKYGNAISTSEVVETVMLINDEREIEKVPPRSMLRLARAPQSFYLKDIIEAHRAAAAEGLSDFIDSCSMMKYYKHEMHMVDGPVENIKITTPMDYYAMKAILDARDKEHEQEV